MPREKNIKASLENILYRLIHTKFLILSVKSHKIMTDLPPPTCSVLLIVYLAPESGKNNRLFLCLPEQIRLIWLAAVVSFVNVQLKIKIYWVIQPQSLLS